MTIASPLYKLPRNDGPPLLHFFEVWEDGSTAVTRTRIGTVAPSQVNDWLDLKGCYSLDGISEGTSELRVILRVIACDFYRHPFAIGCGHVAFEQIRSKFGLTQSSQEAILNNNGAFGRFYQYKSGTLQATSFALVFKVANSLNIGNDSISLSFNLETKITLAFMHGIPESEIKRLFQALKDLKDKSLYEQPLLLPNKLFYRYRQKAEAYRVTIDDSLHKSEVQIGYAIPGLLHGPHPRYYRKAETLAPAGKQDFESITRQIHSCATELGTIKCAGNFGIDLGTFLCQTALELEERLGSRDALIQISNGRAMLHEMEFTTTMFKTLLSQSSILRDRVQNHINLTHSLIAQDENRIARLVAEESAMIAVSTKRDSAAMKTIALLTTVFLPPTFVATFFGMSMFDWRPQQPNGQNSSETGLASSYLWVYWVVAIPLTVFVLASWRLWIHRENQKYQKDLRKAREDRSKTTPALRLSGFEQFTPTKDLMGEYSEAQLEQLNPSQTYS